MDYRKQRAVTKSRNQFHDLFHDIRGRNSFHATRFSTSLSSSSASPSSSPSSPRSPFPSSRTHRRIVCRPEQIRVQEIEEQVDQDPNNLVIGTLIPSSFLHRPRRRLAARSLRADRRRTAHDEGTRFKGRTFPIASLFLRIPSPAFHVYTNAFAYELHRCVFVIRTIRAYRDASIESTVSHFPPLSYPSIGKLLVSLLGWRREGEGSRRKFNHHLSIYYRSVSIESHCSGRTFYRCSSQLFLSLPLSFQSILCVASSIYIHTYIYKIRLEQNLL